MSDWCICCAQKQKLGKAEKGLTSSEVCARRCQTPCARIHIQFCACMLAWSLLHAKLESWIVVPIHAHSCIHPSQKKRKLTQIHSVLRSWVQASKDMHSFFSSLAKKTTETSKPWVSAHQASDDLMSWFDSVSLSSLLLLQCGCKCVYVSD